MFHFVEETKYLRDLKEFHYVASHPFELTNDSRNILIQYVAFILSLRYQKVRTDDSYTSLYGNVYYFTSPGGTNYLDITTDLEETFRSQFTGNCTIHNLKHSLKQLFRMDELTFGLLEDTLLLGFDRWIPSEFVQRDLGLGSVGVYEGNTGHAPKSRVCCS